MDFKGWFRTGDGQRCDPFTITDAHSRYLIRCQAITLMDTAHVRAICESAMREYGVPERIRTDNGAPFSGTGILGLSRLSLEWERLGIVHERIQPGKPQQNGRHERMHRTLKQDTTNSSAKTVRAQQMSFVVSTTTNDLTKRSITRHRGAYMLQAHGYFHAIQKPMFTLLISRRDA
jgi:transposase InsO family protein